MRRLVASCIPLLVCLTCVPAALADVSTASIDDAADAEPTVNGRPTNPDVSNVSATYDSAGSIVITASFFNNVNDLDTSQNYAFFSNFAVGTADTSGSEPRCSTSAQGSLVAGQHHVYGAGSFRFYDQAYVTGYDGVLTFQRTAAPDGRQITITASNANIANRTYDCLTYSLSARRRSTVENINSRYDEWCDCWYVAPTLDVVGDKESSSSAAVIWFAGRKPPPKPACSDGKDNDGDGKSDFNASYPTVGDPGCTSAADTDEFNPPPPECNDGKDNDGDGDADYDLDSGCYGASDPSERADCADSMDNDGDGKVDQSDPGCGFGAKEDSVRRSPKRVIYRKCGNLVRQGAGTYNVVTRLLTCARGRAVARKWERARSCGDGRCRVLGFSCRTRRAGYELVKVRCVSGGRRVSFSNGA